jgi:hypothetical protein
MFTRPQCVRKYRLFRESKIKRGGVHSRRLCCRWRGGEDPNKTTFKHSRLLPKYSLYARDRCDVQVFFSVLMGAMNMGQASPYVEAFSIARGAAAVIFGIMDRTSPIDSSSRDGIRPADLRGRLLLRQLQQHSLSKKLFVSNSVPDP